MELFMWFEYSITLAQDKALMLHLTRSRYRINFCATTCNPGTRRDTWSFRPFLYQRGPTPFHWFHLLWARWQVALKMCKNVGSMLAKNGMHLMNAKNGRGEDQGGEGKGEIMQGERGGKGRD